MHVDDLHVSLGGDKIINSISFSVDSGELVGLVGPNGAGKTTLLRTLAGYLNPDAGEVQINNEDVHSLTSRAASQRVAVVPQSTTFSFEFSVRDVVEMGRHPHRTRFRLREDPNGASHVASALERCELTILEDQPVTAVSGGERKRVLLARALAQDTPVLLLDEPTAGLDINHQIRTLDLIRDLTDDGRRAVAAIHDLSLAARYCDQIIMLSDGRMCASGAPETVISRSSLNDAFDAATAIGTNPVTGSSEVTPLTQSDDADIRVHILGATDAIVGQLEALNEAGYHISVGPVVDGSLDHEAARRLNCPTVTTAPFSTVSDEETTQAMNLIKESDVLIVPSGAEKRSVNPHLATSAGCPVIRESQLNGSKDKKTMLCTAVSDVLNSP